jgi:hypothetical protein
LKRESGSNEILALVMTFQTNQSLYEALRQKRRNLDRSVASQPISGPTAGMAVDVTGNFITNVVSPSIAEQESFEMITSIIITLE